MLQVNNPVFTAVEYESVFLAHFVFKFYIRADQHVAITHLNSFSNAI